MSKKLNVLIIEDHPVILDGFKKILLSNKTHELNITEALNCGDALRLINRSKIKGEFDLFLIDVQLAPSEDGTITSGEDVAVYVKRNFPKAKILILTGIDNTERIKNMLNSTPHDGILIKSDVEPETLLDAFYSVLDNKVYYSSKVKKQKRLTLESEEVIDFFDKKIIYHISKGVKTKDLEKFIDLKTSMIEKRKSAIKQVFNITGGGDAELIKEAEKRGFI